MGFADVIIKPEVRSIVRGLTSKFEAKALYTSGRDELQRELKAELAEALKTRGIIVEDFLLKAIKLPVSWSGRSSRRRKRNRRRSEWNLCCKRSSRRPSAKRSRRKGSQTSRRSSAMASVQIC